MGGATEIGGGPYKEVSISIHAPRGGSDNAELLDAMAAMVISIHAPRGGSDYRGKTVCKDD